MKALLIGMESLPGTPKMREPPSNALGHREPSGMRRGLRCFQRADGGGTESRKADVADERLGVAGMLLVQSWRVSGTRLAKRG